MAKTSLSRPTPKLHSRLGTLATLAGLLLTQAALAQSTPPIERVKIGDAGLDCGAIMRENTNLDQVIAAGDPNGNAVGKAVGGAAANVGGQIAGAALAQGLNSMLGSFGGLFSRNVGQVAQQVAQEQMKPSPEATARATEAQARKTFLLRLATAKECRSDDANFAGKPISVQTFEQLAGLTPSPSPASGGAPAGAAPAAANTVANLQQALGEPVSPVAPVPNMIDGKLDLKGKKFYVAEFRVLFEVGGSVTASTRAGYMPGGTNYGATRATINYNMPKVDIAAMQAITDKAYEDFRKRVEQAGVRLDEPNNFVRANGTVYATTEEPSKPGAPVILDKNNRKYVVMAPTGMKLHSRGFAGLGTGDMSKRMDWSRASIDGLTISMAVNLAALESSGNASSILQRGSSVNAYEGMHVVTAPDSVLLQTHVGSGGLYLVKPVPVQGHFANFKEVGGYNTATDSVAQSMAFLSNRAGVAANNSSRTEMEFEVDTGAMARMALSGIATVNQAIVERIRAGL